MVPYNRAMTPKERFEACVKLAEFSATRWDARRAYEWKLSLGLWALLAAAIHSFRVDTIPLWLPLVVFAMYLFWMNNVWWANYLDRMMMRTYREYATKLLNEDGEIHVDKHRPKLPRWLAVHPKINRYLGFLVDWATLFQITVTGLLVWLAYWYCQINLYNAD